VERRQISERPRQNCRKCCPDKHNVLPEIRQKQNFAICLFLLVALSAPATLLAASFDCAKASSRIEKLICGNPKLSQMDERLYSAYLEALATTDNPVSLRTEQRRWVSDVRGKCTDAACLETTHATRITELANASERDSEKCRVSESQLLGAWLQEGDGDFEELAFGDETRKEFFISWQHHRPDMIGTWHLQACTLTIKHIDKNDLQFSYKVLNLRNNVLYLKDAGSKELSSYKRYVDRLKK
jgi:uncharacterized protein